MRKLRRREPIRESFGEFSSHRREKRKLERRGIIEEGDGAFLSVKFLRGIKGYEAQKIEELYVVRATRCYCSMWRAQTA